MYYSFISKVKQSFHTASGRSGCFEFLFSFSSAIFAFSSEIAIFQSVKICQILHVIFERTSQFSFRFCINLQYHQTQLICSFLTQALYALVKSSPLKCKCFRFWSARVKICQIPHANFELTSQFLFKFYIILQYPDT